MTKYDVLIIGGGIHGAGVAQAAAAAGLRVLVMEKTALAAGTSGRSSKLIHGGLRYLEHGQLGLVRDCLRERSLLLTLAPELVRLVSFHIPVYETSSRSPRLVRSGLSLYALLAGMSRESRFRLVPRAEWSQLDGLDLQGLKAVFRYQEGVTDDVALTRSVMASAAALGAEIWMPATVENGELTRDGCTLWCSQGGRIVEVQARVVVNAAGPWARRLLDRIRFLPILPPDMELVAGSHLVVAGTLQQGAYYLESPEDRRPVFVMPWQHHILVGTTERPWHGDPGKVAATEEEKAYLRLVLARHFTGLGQAPELASFAGLRVLPTTNHTLSQRSRETLLWVDRTPLPRLLTIFGGKLTAYRATAENVLAQLAGSLPDTTRRGDPHRIILTPAE